MLSGLIIAIVVEEPARGGAEPDAIYDNMFKSGNKQRVSLSDWARLLSIATFWISIVQGLFFAIPWVVLGQFFGTWLHEARDMSTAFSLTEKSVPSVLLFIVIGMMCGHLVGGYVGDWAERRSLNYGRVVVGQASIATSALLSWIVFSASEGWSVQVWILVSLLIGFITSWVAPAMADPILQGVIPPELRGSAASLKTLVIGSVSSVGCLVVGSMAGDTAAGFTRVLRWSVTSCWLVSLICCIGLYRSYSQDRRHLRDRFLAFSVPRSFRD
jgi:hypothetical protein